MIDDYRMITGKRSHCVNEASERVYSLENDEGQALEVTFRVYNDGIAFKYGLKAISDEEHIINEYTAYALPQGSKRWIQQYDPGYEKFSRCLLMVSLPIARRLTFGDIRRL